MRAVGLTDLDMAARALLMVPEARWRDVAADLLAKAHTADLWRKRHGVAHPAGGTGSLYAQAALLPRAASSECSARYCAALGVVLAQLKHWRGRHHRAL